MAEQVDQRSWWRKTLGRSVLKALVGDFFSSERNTASIIAIILIGTMCWVVVDARRYEFLNTLANIVFTIVGYYFASKPRRDDASDDGA